MSNSSDKPAPHDAPQNVTDPDAPPAEAPVQGPGLPSYMTGPATPAGSDSDVEPKGPTAPDLSETAAEPYAPEPDDDVRTEPASPSLGDAVRAAQRDAEPAIAVTPEGDAHMPPPETDRAGQPEADAAPDREAPETPWWQKDAAPAAQSAASGTTAAKTAAPSQGKSAAPSPGKAAPGAKSTAKGTAKPQRPASVPFGKSHPLLAVEQPLPPSMASRLYTVFAVLPLLWLTLSVILQTLFSLNARELWAGQEAVNAALLQGLAHSGPSALLSLNGEVFTGQPPLYIWFLRGLYEALRTDGPMLHLAAAAVSCMLYLWAVLGLGRCVGRLDGRSNLASGIILLSTVAVTALAHYASSELLFAALVTASLILLYRSFISASNSPFGMILAFVLAGAASLVQGPLGIAIPLLAVVLFALWRGNAAQTRCVLVSMLALLCGLVPVLYGLPLLQAFGLLPDASALSMEWGLALLAPPALLLLALAAFAPSLRICAALSLLLLTAAFVLTGGTPYFTWPLGYALPCLLAALFVLWQLTPQRLFRMDFFIGAAAGLAVIAVWPALIFLESGNLSLLTDVLLKEYVLAPALAALALEGGWLGTLALLPLLLLPWLLAVVFLPWHGFLGKSMREGLAASRRPEKEGLAFLWCSALAALLLVCALKDRSAWDFLPAFGPLACLAGRAVMGLSGRRASGFRLGMAALTLAAGVLTILYGLMLFNILPQPAFLGLPEWKMASHGGFFVTGAILLVAGALIWFGLGSSRPEGVLLIMALTVTGLGYPLGSLVAPHFDALLSPKAQALTLRAYADKGYAVASYNVPEGAYAFYAATRVKALDAPGPENLAALGQNAVLALPAADYEALADKPEGFAVAQRQWMGCKEYVLLASPVIEGLAPAAVSYKPAPDIIDEFLKLTGIDGWLTSIGFGGTAAPANPAAPAREETKPAPAAEPQVEPQAEPQAEPAQPEAPGKATGKVTGEAAGETAPGQAEAEPAPEATPAPESREDGASADGTPAAAEPSQTDPAGTPPAPGADETPTPTEQAAPAPETPETEAPGTDAPGADAPGTDAPGTPPAADDAAPADTAPAPVDDAAQADTAPAPADTTPADDTAPVDATQTGDATTADGQEPDAGQPEAAPAEAGGQDAGQTDTQPDGQTDGQADGEPNPDAGQAREDAADPAPQEPSGSDAAAPAEETAQQ